jgi:D-glycero-alpha-D-manno-heptose-7-phosphate kinase
MLIISRTPLRLSFLGGGTDYPLFYKEYGGAVLGTTIDQYTYLSVKSSRSSFFEHNIRIAYSKTEFVKEIDEIEHPSVRESLKYMGCLDNLDIHIFSDLPAKTGLGSSSSFTVGLLNALHVLQSKTCSKQDLAERACYVEQTLICENVGSQDQFHAAFGGFNIMEFTSNHIQVKPLQITETKKKYLEEHLLVFYTGLTRFASLIVKEQLENMWQKRHILALKKMILMASEGRDILTELSGDEMLKKFGELLSEGWELKKRLSKNISNSQIDAAYKEAMAAGAYGGKLCGAGGGGFLIFLSPDEKKEKIRNALNGLLQIELKFENKGSSIIYKKE